MNIVIKSSLTLFVTMLISFSVFAETLKIIIPAGADGSFNTRFQILKTDIEKTWGDSIKFVYGDNCMRGKNLMENEKGPMLTIWDAGFNLSKECNFKVTKKNIIAVETNGLRLCAKADSYFTAESLTTAGATYTVGHSTPHTAYQKWINGYNTSTGTLLKAIPYSSSGKARRGLIAGDIDFVFISPSNSNKLMKAGGICFFSTLEGGEPKHSLPALASVTSFDKAVINQSYFYAVKNVDKKKIKALRQLFSNIADGDSSAFTKFVGTKDIYMKGMNQMNEKEMVKLINNTVNYWK